MNNWIRTLDGISGTYVFQFYIRRVKLKLWHYKYLLKSASWSNACHLWYVAVELVSNSWETLQFPACPVNSSPLNKMVAISQTIFSDAFSWMKIFIFWVQFHLILFLWVQLTITQHWFRQWLGAEYATSHYLNQWWPHSLTHVCGTRGICLDLTEKWRQALDSRWYLALYFWALAKHLDAYHIVPFCISCMNMTCLKTCVIWSTHI